MIRRQAQHEFHLIAQDDHARLSGRLARHLGGARFDRPEPFERVVEAITLHDSGWPLHDDQPTLDSDGLPTDVFESPLKISLNAWNASTERAMAADPYAGLLVSLHGLALSALAAAPDAQGRVRRLQRSARQTFELNRFQHRQIEIQEDLRRQLGLQTDRPLTLGLDPDSADPREQVLMRNFHLLQAMDLLSLAICCTHPPASQSSLLRPGGSRPVIRLDLQRRGNDLRVHPWPFDVPVISCEVPYRAVPVQSFDDLEIFHRAFAAAEPAALHVKVSEQ